MLIVFRFSVWSATRPLLLRVRLLIVHIFDLIVTVIYTVNLTLLDLARNQPAQRKLREDVLSLGDNTLDFDAVQKLQYLDAVVREG